MAEVIGFAERVYQQFTCDKCAAIVKYAPIEVQPLMAHGVKMTDEGCTIMGLNCPNCHSFHRTNP